MVGFPRCARAGANIFTDTWKVENKMAVKRARRVFECVDKYAYETLFVKFVKIKDGSYAVC